MPQKIALLIGNSEYTDGKLSHLNTPQADVNRVAEVLRNPEIGNFTQVTVLLNRRADTVRRQIARLFADRQRDDLLLLYFSGHGVKDDEGHLHLAVYDTEHKFLDATAMPASFITRHMDRSRSRRQVLILDCCHSGAFERGTKGSLGESVGAEATFKGTGYGRYVLTASDAMQYAWEDDRVVGKAETSVFTQFLIEGLQTGKADINSDGLITIDELYDYIYEKVTTRTSKQTPCKWTYSEQGDVTIANNSHLISSAKEEENAPINVKSDSMALRHDLIVRSPLADLIFGIDPLSWFMIYESPVDWLSELKQGNRKFGSCGVTSMILTKPGDRLPTTNEWHSDRIGFQVWLHDAYSRETSTINLESRRLGTKYQEVLKAKGETVHPKIGSIYYRETTNLLMQITVLNFENDMLLLILSNFLSTLAGFLKKRESKPPRKYYIKLRFRVWSKSQGIPE